MVLKSQLRISFHANLIKRNDAYICFVVFVSALLVMSFLWVAAVFCAVSLVIWLKWQSFLRAHIRINAFIRLFIYFVPSGLKCRRSSIRTRTSHARWLEAGTPGTGSRIKLVRSSNTTASVRDEQEETSSFGWRGRNLSGWNMSCVGFGSKVPADTLVDSPATNLFLHMTIYSWWRVLGAFSDNKEWQHDGGGCVGVVGPSTVL